MIDQFGKHMPCFILKTVLTTNTKNGERLWGTVFNSQEEKENPWNSLVLILSFLIFVVLFCFLNACAPRIFKEERMTHLCSWYPVSFRSLYSTLGSCSFAPSGRVCTGPSWAAPTCTEPAQNLPFWVNAISLLSHKSGFCKPYKISGHTISADT